MLRYNNSAPKEQKASPAQPKAHAVSRRAGGDVEVKLKALKERDKSAFIWKLK